MKDNKKRTKTAYPGVVSLGAGRYRIRVYWTDPLTKQQKERMRTVTARSAKDAYGLREREERRLLASLRVRAEGGLPSSTKFGELADAWLDEVCARKHEEDPMQLHLTPATRARYTATVVQYLVPFFGDMRSDRIQMEHVRLWREDLLKVGLARATVNAHHRVLKTVLATVGNDAAKRVKALNERRDARITRKEPNLLNPQELDRFLEVAKARWPQHYALILLLFTTTMRIGTALALRWDDLDLETMEIVASRRLSGHGSKVEVVPGVKRDRFGEDVPPLLEEVLTELRKLRSSFNEVQLASGLMFPTPDGRHHSRTILYKPFNDIREHAGITKRFTPHGCRRTGAKLYGRTAGTRMAMDITGHRTEAMHRHYTPVDAAEKSAAGRRAFAGLRVIAGGLEDSTGILTGTSSDSEESAPSKLLK